MNISYIYRLHYRTASERAVEVVTSIAEVSSKVGVSETTLYAKLKASDSCTVKGWDVVRLERPAPDGDRDTGRGVMVYTVDDGTLTFRSKDGCAKAMDISIDTIRRRLMDGLPDRNGNYYDIPLERRAE